MYIGSDESTKVRFSPRTCKFFPVGHVEFSVLRRERANLVLKKAKFAGLDPELVGTYPGVYGENFNEL